VTLARDLHVRLSTRLDSGDHLGEGRVIRLYHLPGSRSTRILWMLEEIGVPYEVKLMTREERKTAEHIGRHPLGRVPVVELDDGGFLFESAAICLQLADLHPEARLIPPPGSPARGRVYQWCLFAMTELEPPAHLRARAGSCLRRTRPARVQPTSALRAHDRR